MLLLSEFIFVNVLIIACNVAKLRCKHLKKMRLSSKTFVSQLYGHLFGCLNMQLSKLFVIFLHLYLLILLVQVHY